MRSFSLLRSEPGADGDSVTRRLGARGRCLRAFGFALLALMVRLACGPLTAAPLPDTVVCLGIGAAVPTNATGVVALAASRYHSLALTLAGQVIAWGANDSGQSSVPADLSNVVSIAAGDYHSMALTADGRLRVWGTATNADLPPSATNVTAIAAGGLHSLALRSDGSVVAWGLDNHGQVQVPSNLSDVVAVAGGYFHSLALRRDGTVVAWGDNRFGQINVPAQATNVAAISASGFQNLVLRRDGTLWQWGDSRFDLGIIPDSATNVIRISAGFHHNLALRPDASVVGWGYGGSGETTIPEGLRDVTAIAAGGDRSLLAIAAGFPLFEEQHPRWSLPSGTPVKLDARALGGAVAQFEWLHDGVPLSESGHLLEMGPASTSLAGLYSVVGISMGRRATGTLELTVTGPRLLLQPASQTNFLGGTTIMTTAGDGLAPIEYQWFFNGEPLTGATNSSLTLASVSFAHAGNYSALVRDPVGTVLSSNASLTVNSVAAWGYNPYGQTNVPAGTTNIVALAAGADHTVALTERGTVRAWGGNLYGQINFPSDLTNVAAVAAGHYHTLVLNSNGTVSAWGRNDGGQTNVPAGLTDVVSVSAGWFHSLALRSNGTVVAWGGNSFGQTNVPPEATNVVAISAGQEFNTALRADGRVLAWGRSLSGELNVTPGLGRVVAVSSAGNHSLALRDDGTVVAWGLNSVGQTNVPAQATNIIAIAAGHGHNLALRQDGEVLAWGYNAHGEINVPPPLANVIALAAGYFHSASAIGDGRIVLPFRATRREAHTGNTITLHAMAAGAGPLVYQWQFNGVNIPDATNAWLVLTNLQTTQAGAYRVLVSNALGQAASETVLGVDDAALSLGYEPVSVVSYPGASVAFEVGAYGSGPIEYQWRHDGIPLPGASNHLLVLNPVRLNQRGNYSALVQNVFGSVTTSNAELFIPPVNVFGAYTTSVPSPPNCGDLPVFVPKDLPDSVMAVAGGYEHSMALLADGTVRAWGRLNSGDWCYANWDQTNVPPNLTNVVAIAAGAYHSLALRSDGTVVAWGKNNRGQCTVPSYMTNVAAIAAGEDFTVTLSRDGTVAAWGYIVGTNAVAGLTNIMAISASSLHALALREDGTVVAWGRNLSGATNVPPGLSNVVAIWAGNRQSLALRDDGTVASWGTHTNVPPTLTNVVAVLGGAAMHFLKADGTLSSWGSCGDCYTGLPGLSNVVAAASGLAHTLVVVGEGFPPSANSTAVLGSPRYSNGEFTLALPTERGRVYALETTSSLGASNWTAFPLILGDGSVKELKHHPSDSAQQFYRVRRWR